MDFYVPCFDQTLFCTLARNFTSFHVYFIKEPTCIKYLNRFVTHLNNLYSRELEKKDEVFMCCCCCSASSSAAVLVVVTTPSILLSTPFIFPFFRLGFQERPVFLYALYPFSSLGLNFLLLFYFFFHSYSFVCAF